MSIKEEKEEQKRKTAYERLQHARSWVWSAWTDEAVMVYRRSAHGKDRAHVLWVEFLLFIREVLRDFYRFEGSTRAASLAYTTLLSLIPLIIAFSQVLTMYFEKGFPLLREQIDAFLNLIVPYESGRIAYHVNQFAAKAGEASTFGAAVFLIISFRLFMAVEGTVNQIWRVESGRGYRHKLRAYTMLLFWGPLLMGVSFTTQASLQKNASLQMFIENAFVRNLVPALFMFVAFTMLFWLVPATKVRFASAVFGAAVTAILFELVRWAFGLYAAHLFTGNLNVIYGTLGLMIIFLFALELMWVVILLGVEVSYVHQNLQGILRASEHQLEESRSFNLYFALRALIEVSRRFELREEAPSSYRLAQEFGATDRQMLEVLQQLEDAQLVKEIGGDWTGYVPGCDPDRITVDEVVRQMEGGYREIPSKTTMDEATQAIAELFDTLFKCTTTSLDNRTIGQMVRILYHGPQAASRQSDILPERS